jgi:RimJ/RimL family protein N-acetyltransferase
VVELSGERVLLRALRPQEHDRFVAERMALTEGVAVTTFAEADLRKRAAVSGELTERGLLLAIDVKGRAVGEVSAYRVGMPDGVYGLGLTVWDEADRGRGIGTEAVAVLARHVFDELGARRLEAGTNVDNTPMIAVLDRLGFVREGVLRRYFPSAAGGIDCAVYALTTDDWENLKETWTRTS